MFYQIIFYSAEQPWQIIFNLMGQFRQKNFGGTVPANNFLFARTVPANNLLFAGTVPANSFPQTYKPQSTAQSVCQISSLSVLRLGRYQGLRSSIILTKLASEYL